MIKDNRRQKLRLLTEWMDYFLLENKDEIKRSLNAEGIVFIQNKLENENYVADFGLMILSNQDVDLTLRLTLNSGEEEGKSFWFDIRKRPTTGVILFNEDGDEKSLVRYQLKNFLQYASHRAFLHLEEWMAEAEDNRKLTESYQPEVEMVIQEALVNFYLDKGDYEALKLMFPKADEGNQ